MTGSGRNRWAVLAVLFAARVTMAFQFQAVAAISPVYMARYGVSLADLGLLIGLYLAPGLLIALPGGAIGRRFGDRRAVACGMVLMVVGALLMAWLPSWNGQLAGRVLAGTGGVLLNVLMSKLVADHFAGREIGTAMAIFVNSWPVGIAAALVVLPILGGGSVIITQAVVFSAALAGLVLFLSATDADAGRSAMPPGSARLAGAPLWAAITAGAIWGLYNGAIGTIFGFAPAMLVERGWTLAAASSATSLVLWLMALSIPLGGIVADRTGRRDTVMLVSFAGFAALLAYAPATGQVVPVFVLLGLCGGLAAGPIMSLPVQVLTPGTRALGMGIFFTLFYAGVVLAPILAGAVSQRVGTAGAALHLGATMSVLCIAALGVFRWLASPPRGARPA